MEKPCASVAKDLGDGLSDGFADGFEGHVDGVPRTTPGGCTQSWRVRVELGGVKVGDFRGKSAA